jgi:hypothetical protein
MPIKLFCFAAFLGFVTVACDPFNSGGKHPSDAKLARNFEEHEEAFNKLVRMSNEDRRVIRVAPDFTRLETNWAWPRPDSELGFTRRRWEEYRKLFNQLGLESGLFRETSSNGAAIYLVASSKGMTMRGSSKGYVFSEKPVTNVVKSLDGKVSRPANLEHGALYTPLKEHWYLCYEW